MPQDVRVILFHYPISIFSQRVLWYLKLRKIEYTSCIQPVILPRPDLSALSITHRRIPILAIGSYIYCDSRLIIQALEQHFPDPSHTCSAVTPDEKLTQKLLERYTIDSGIFLHAVTLLPVWKDPTRIDPAFIADRTEMMGGGWDPAMLVQGETHALSQIRTAFDLLETTVLADGRPFVFSGRATSTVADIDAVFVLQWLVRDPIMTGAVPAEFVSEKIYPRTFAWIDRFLAVVGEAGGSAPVVHTLTGEEAVEHILNARSPEQDAEGEVDPTDPTQLKRNDMVAVHPTDTGRAHVDHGRLVTLTMNEVVLVNHKGLHLHFPRWGFDVSVAASASASA